MSTDKTATLLCPMCGAENDRDAARCFLCGQSLAGAESAAGKKLGDRAATSRWKGVHPNLVILLIALVAVLLGVWAEAPGVAVAIAIPAAIALARTRTAIETRPRSALDLVGIVLGTFAGIILVLVAASAAVLLTCTSFFAVGAATGMESVMGIGIGCSALAGIATAFFVTRYLLRRQRLAPVKGEGPPR